MFRFAATWIKNIFVYIVKACNYFVSGRREFDLTLRSFDLYAKPNVTECFVGKKIMEAVKLDIKEKYSVCVNLPVVLELVKENSSFKFKFDWKTDNVGKYHSQMMMHEKYHMVYVISGLSIARFKAVAAHELMHAFLYEHKLFTESLVFREAMARWMEYSVLLDEGDKKSAEKLLKIKAPKSGGGLPKILELEKKVKKTELVEWLIENRNKIDIAEILVK